MPYPQIPQFDRARAFEYALEEAWADVATEPNQDFFRSFLRTAWKPTGITPLLMLNTTVADTGKQHIVTPVSIPNSADPLIPLFGDASRLGVISSAFDVRLSTAVGISARFPGITPSGYHSKVEKTPFGYEFGVPRFRLVDGGYADNTGLTTAYRLISYLLYEETEVDNIDFRTVVVGGDNPVFSSFTFHPFGLNEIMSPINAILNAHSNYNKERIQRALEQRSTIQMGLQREYLDFPLGWVLSKKSQTAIAAHFGSPELCLRVNESRYQEMKIELQSKLDWAVKNKLVPFLKKNSREAKKMLREKTEFPFWANMIINMIITEKDLDKIKTIALELEQGKYIKEVVEEVWPDYLLLWNSLNHNNCEACEMILAIQSKNTFDVESSLPCAGLNAVKY